MDVPFDDILTVIRRLTDPQSAFADLRAIGELRSPSPMWRAIKTPDVRADVDAAASWLYGTITPFRPTGVYLGLDTLNERDGQGKNVEIGMTIKADPVPLNMDWAYRCEKYGDDHLIRGMYETHQTYKAFGLEYEVGLLADYLFFLGYSGIVLTAAIEKLRVEGPTMFVWGFHDGDIGFLARSSPDGVERLVTFDGA
jgi:hypothetical protein